MTAIKAMRCGAWTAEVAEHEREIEKIRLTVRSSTAKAIFAIGKELTEAQEKLACHGKGTFGKWVKTRLKMSRRLMYLHLRVYRVFEKVDCATVAQFDRSALYYLVHGGIPTDAVKDLIARAQNGARITQKMAKALVGAYLHDKQFPQDSANDDSKNPGNAPKVGKVNMSKPPSVLDRLKRAWDEATPQERDEFKRWATSRTKNITVPNTLV